MSQRTETNNEGETTRGAAEATVDPSSPIHETTIYAEPLFHIGNFSITNSFILSCLVLIFFVVLALELRSSLKKIPGFLQGIFEIIVEKALELCDTVTVSREKSLQLFPLAFVLFLFILVNNWSGLVPGVGSIGFVEYHGKDAFFIPLLRGGTADVNTTLALALLSIVLTHIFGVLAVGGWHYLNKFVNIKSFLEIPQKVWNNPTVLLINPIKAFIGLVECIGEIAKVASLSFRLFGNIFAGEVLLVSISALLAYFAPIPFLFLELLVGFIQALVFSMLILVFSTIAITKEEH